MRFTILCKNAGDVFAVSSGTAWEEKYERHEITTLAQARAWATLTIENFNATLKPGEKAREVIEVSATDAKPDMPVRHQWEKTSLVTESKNGALFDRMRCTNCDITGKRYGLGPDVVRDKQFKAKKWNTCPGHE